MFTKLYAEICTGKEGNKNQALLALSVPKIKSKEESIDLENDGDDDDDEDVDDIINSPGR